MALSPQELGTPQNRGNSSVGMIGHSYVGSTPIVATALKPKGLVTIVPSAGLPAIYDHQWQMGVAYNAQYLGPIEAYQQLALQRELPIKIALPTDMGMTGEHFGKDLLQIGCGLKDSALSSGEQLAGVNTPWHQQRDASKAAAAFPGSVFVIHGENDQAARIANLHWLYDRGPRPQDKVWIGQWDHGIGCCPNRRGAQWVGAIHAWFDHELLARNVATGPPVEIFMNDEPTVPAAIPARKEIYTSPSWPPAVSRTLTLYASGDGTLREGQGTAGARSFSGDPKWLLGQQHRQRDVHVCAHDGRHDRAGPAEAHARQRGDARPAEPHRHPVLRARLRPAPDLPMRDEPAATWRVRPHHSSPTGCAHAAEPAVLHGLPAPPSR
jgi:predicted acyl esterase